MAAKVKWKECCCLLVVFVISVNGMFVHRHCSHVHPKYDEVRKQNKAIFGTGFDSDICCLEPVTFRKGCLLFKVSSISLPSMHVYAYVSCH